MCVFHLQHIYVFSRTEKMSFELIFIIILRHRELKMASTDKLTLYNLNVTWLNVESIFTRNIFLEKSSEELTMTSIVEQNKAIH